MFRLDTKQAILDHAANTTPRREQQAALTEAAVRIAAQPAEGTMSAAVIVGVTQAAEAVLLAALGFAIFALYVKDSHELGFYAAVTLGTVLVANIMLNAARTHRIPLYRTALRQLGRVLAAWSVVLVPSLGSRAINGSPRRPQTTPSLGRSGACSISTANLPTTTSAVRI